MQRVWYEGCPKSNAQRALAGLVGNVDSWSKRQCVDWSLKNTLLSYGSGIRLKGKC